MAGLSETYRKFVLELMELGPTKKASAIAAKRAGLSPNHGYKLMRDQRVLDAIHEEAGKSLIGGALIGVKRLIEIAQDRDHKDSYKAAKDLAAINGFSPEQKITVEHIDRDGKAIIDQIRSMAKQLGLDPSILISGVGIIEDGEFTEIEDDG